MKVLGGLFELSFGHLPKANCHATELLLDISSSYSKGFVSQGQLHGSVAIVIRHGAEIADPSLVETSADQRAVAPQRMHAEDALRESEQRYRELADSLPETIFETGLTGQLTFINRSARERLGLSQDDPIDGINIADLVVPEDRGRVMRDIAGVLAGKSVEAKEFTAPGREGATVSVIVSATRIVRDGTVVGLRGVAVDVSARREAANALRESEARFRVVFNGATMGMGLIDENGRFIEGNLALQRMLGYSEVELRERTFTEITHPDDVASSVKFFGQLVAGVRDHYQMAKRYLQRDGGVIWVRLTVSIVRGVHGEPRFIIGVMEDTTERRQLDRQLLRAQRLEAVGQMAARVAHDLRNLLIPLTRFPELIRMELPDGEPAADMCDQMLEAAKEVTAINEDMLALARRVHDEHRPTDLNEVVQRAVRETIIDSPPGLVVKLDLSTSLLPVTGSSAQLVRVVANLVSNACEAMENAGCLAIKTENVYIDKPIGVYNRVEIGEYVRLSISDTGPGILPEISEKIFDTFFTTKHAAARPGTGLGLSIVQTIVDDHRGYIDLQTEVGKGTTFSVYLPLSRESAEAG